MSQLPTIETIESFLNFSPSSSFAGNDAYELDKKLVMAIGMCVMAGQRGEALNWIRKTRADAVHAYLMAHQPKDKGDV